MEAGVPGNKFGGIVDFGRFVAILQARHGSERLPGKILAPVAEGLNMLQLIHRRVSIPGLDFWCATTSLEEDDATAACAEALGMRVFRGDEKDVLSRFVEIKELVRPDWVIRLTGDNPFTDASIVRRLVERAHEAPASTWLIADLPPKTRFPLGFVPQIVRAEALSFASREIPADADHHRAHVTSFLIPDFAESFQDDAYAARPHWRWTVDTRADLDMAREVFASVGQNGVDADYPTLVRLLDARPDLVAMNSSIAQRKIENG